MLRTLILIVILGWGGLARGGPAGIEDTWSGALDVGALKLHLVIHVKRAGDALTATLDSPDQGATGIPFDKATFTPPTLKLELTKAHATFEAKLDGDRLVGTWTQGQALPVTLTRGASKEVVRRPQTPAPPFPYKTQDVTVDVLAAPRTRSDAKIALAGTLTIPDGAGPFPAVVLVTGSGPQDRDETILQHRPFAVLADALARRGIASLRLDDRGVGKSAKGPAEATTLDLVEDVRQELAWLAARPELDRRALGVVGHSEGAVIGPIVATRTADAKLVVMLAGTGMIGSKVLIAQAGALGAAMGEPAAKVARERAEIEQLYRQLRAAKTEAARTAAIHAFVAADPARKGFETQLADPWMLAFVALDPVPYLAQVRVPVLAIAGDKDLQVLPENLPLIAAALKRAKNPDVTTKLLPGLNHLFQHTKTGLPSEYGTIEETFAPEALQLIGDWLTERVAKLRP